VEDDMTRSAVSTNWIINARVASVAILVGIALASAAAPAAHAVSAERTGVATAPADQAAGPTISSFTARAATTYRRMLARIGPAPRRAPTGRRLARRMLLWRGLYVTARRDLRTLDVASTRDPGQRLVRTCALVPLGRIVGAGRSGWAAHRALARGRVTSYRRQLASTRGVGQAVSLLASCARIAQRAPAPAPGPTTPADPPAPGPTTPSRPPASARVEEFWGITDVLGPAFARMVPAGGTIAGCPQGLGINEISVFFATSGVDAGSLQVVWRLPSGEQFGPVPPDGFNDATGRGNASIRRQGDMPLLDGVYGFALALAGVALSEASVTVACGTAP
jgi:hypothetical protein